MKRISELFSDEEKKLLSYLGSMLRREPTEEEMELERIIVTAPDARARGAGAKEKDTVSAFLRRSALVLDGVERKGRGTPSLVVDVSGQA
jgi:hypothetical protein